MQKHRVLIFPAGSEIGLEIHNALKYSHHIEIYGASGKSDHAAFIYDSDHYIEDEFYIDRQDFVVRFNAMLKKLKIEFIFPTHDSVAFFLALHQNDLNAQVLSSCAETNRIARSKLRTYQLFSSYGFCPQVFSPPYQDLSFPIFMKPIDGQGGKGTYIAENNNDLAFYLGKNPDLLITEFLPGEELSVDCFTDFNGNLLFVGPRTRERIQMGISFRSTAVVLTEEIRQIAFSINSAVSLNGAWFFQIKKDVSNKFKLMEFAPRQSSTMGLYRHVGINFSLLSFFNAFGKPVTILKNDYAVQLDRCLHNRFKAQLTFSRVYIDFDETLVVGKHVYELVMAFLYQCRNRGIEIVLLTKHRYDIRMTLLERGISEKLFDDIIQLAETEEKWSSINPEGAIFIDNYWFDRQAVSTKLGIPVFDVDAIECLLL